MRTSGRWSALGLPLLGATTTIAGWWLVTIVFDIRPFFLPAPPDVLDALRREPAYLLEATWVTLWETLAGFAIAAGAGLVVALLLAASPAVERATMPMIVAFNAVPKVAVAPLLVLWMGYGPRPKIALVALIAFFPVVVSTMAGLTSTPAELGELSRSLSASRWQSYAKIRVPWALPQVFVGLKLAISLAVIGAVVAEIQSPNSGLGAVIVLTGQSADTPLAFAAIGLLALLGISLFYLVATAERLLLPWAREISTHGSH
ncbi:ABC transporter permease [Micromonospora sp. NPDC050397]|uniref:ABC transporter permease n=1 Tax=Micromonospora sp. NPDC050397 TaxID=3364279 RepID=UPI00385057A6